jgi:hypothetical protein
VQVFISCGAAPSCGQNAENTKLLEDSFEGPSGEGAAEVPLGQTQGSQ